MAGRVVIVTGGGHGIGAAVSSRLAGEGAKVMVADIDAEAAAEIASAITDQGGTAWPEAMDVSSLEGWERARAHLESLGEVADSVVHSAFTLKVAPVHEQSNKDWDRQVSVDLGAVHRSMRSLWGHLSSSLERTGRPACMILISSVHAAVGLPGHPAYAASKAGLVALGRQMSVEYGTRLRVNSVLPGPVLTRTWDGASPDAIERARQQTTLGRMGTPEEVAAAVAFLASDDGSFITGTSLLVDGGWSASREGRDGANRQ